MTDTPDAIRPMEGHGAYNRSSRVQAAGLAPAVALLEQAAHDVALAPAPEPVVIADYGSSAGRNSLLPMGVATRAIRARIGAGRPISVVHTDLPDNDFPALFQTLAGDPDSYLRADPAAFASAVGRSYFGQILPSGSVTLAWSSWAIQWLSRVPAIIPDHVQIAFSADSAAHAAYKRQADEDWRTFLIHRSRELRPGGYLVVLTMAIDAQGRFGYGPLLDAIYATLVGMVGDRTLSADELRRMVIPTVARSEEDLTAPFRDGSFPELTIEHVEVFPAEDRIWASFEADRDARAYAAQWAAFSRASVFPTMAAALDAGDDAARPARFIDALEAGVIARLGTAPAPMLIPLAKIMLRKR